jgi:hypothetical protein
LQCAPDAGKKRSPAQSGSFLTLFAEALRKLLGRLERQKAGHPGSYPDDT